MGRPGRLFDQDTAHLNESSTPHNGETLEYGVCTETSGRKYEIRESDLTDQISTGDEVELTIEKEATTTLDHQLYGVLAVSIKTKYTVFDAARRAKHGRTLTAAGEAKEPSVLMILMNFLDGKRLVPLDLHLSLGRRTSLTRTLSHAPHTRPLHLMAPPTYLPRTTYAYEGGPDYATEESVMEYLVRRPGDGGYSTAFRGSVGDMMEHASNGQFLFKRENAKVCQSH